MPLNFNNRSKLVFISEAHMCTHWNSISFEWTAMRQSIALLVSIKCWKCVFVRYLFWSITNYKSISYRNEYDWKVICIMQYEILKAFSFNWNIPLMQTNSQVHFCSTLAFTWMSIQYKGISPRRSRNRRKSYFRRAEFLSSQMSFFFRPSCTLNRWS